MAAPAASPVPVAGPAPDADRAGRVVASYLVSRRPTAIPHERWDSGAWSTVGQPARQRKPRVLRGFLPWAVRDSNPRPPACKAWRIRLRGLPGVTPPHELALRHDGARLDGTHEVDQQVDQFVATSGSERTKRPRAKRLRELTALLAQEEASSHALRPESATRRCTRRRGRERRRSGGRR